METLETVQGPRPLWPILLGQTLSAEFIRQMDLDYSYARDVFKDKDTSDIKNGSQEPHQVANLFHLAHQKDGCLLLPRKDRIWLLGFQWPTQGGNAEKRRQADLVGLTQIGGLVVFEAKAANGTAPLHAICEGLDYLACLMRPNNFIKIVEGFKVWKNKPGKRIPEGFEEVAPSREAKPSLIILAPEKYYTGRHARSVRSKDWPILARCGPSFIPAVDFHFVATDYRSTTLWSPPEHKI